ncbi:hypothetical protein ONZ45_g16565 [Pleurotus djamor]|nr:hypothetical protein ONZ45_g16565 [Pleurotus djamor]
MMDARWDALLDWLRDHGMKIGDEGLLVERKERPDAGFGLFACRSCPPSTDLFTIPANALLNSKTLSPHYPSSSKLSATCLISLHLLLHRPIGEDNSADPLFGPYISVLPRDFESHPLTWRVRRELSSDTVVEGKLLESLPGSEKSGLNELWMRLIKDWRLSCNYVRTHKDLLSKSATRTLAFEQFNEDNADILLDFTWAWLNVNTRCISYRIKTASSDPDNFTLCPILDFANHNPDTSAGMTPLHLSGDIWNAPSATCKDFTLRTSGKSATGSGDELYLTYGAHSNTTLFLEYGFINPFTHKAILEGSFAGEVDVGEAMQTLFNSGGSKRGAWLREVLEREGYWGDWTLHSAPAPAHPSFRLITALRLHSLVRSDGFDDQDESLERLVQSWREVHLGVLEFISQSNETAWRGILEHLCVDIEQEAAEGLEKTKAMSRSLDDANLSAWEVFMVGNVEQLWIERGTVAKAQLQLSFLQVSSVSLPSTHGGRTPPGYQSPKGFHSDNHDPYVPVLRFLARVSPGIDVAEAIIVLVMVAITFSLVSDAIDSFDSNSGYKTLPCFLALFALAEIFQLLMAFDALRLRNVIQLFGILIFHLGMMVFAAVQVEQTRIALVIGENCDTDWTSTLCDGPGSLWNRVEPFLIVAPCVIAASWIVMLFFVKQLYAEFGWAIFHVVGANPKMKTMYQWYQIMICLLKFDFFCFTGVTMQLLIIVLNRDSAEFGITIAAIPIVLFLLAACGYSVQREIKWLMSISLVIMLAAMSYFYKLVRFYQPASRDQYVSTRVSLTIFTIVAFLILFATFVVGLRCFSDFDQGLESSKTHALQSRPKLSNGDSAASMSQIGRNSSYMAGQPLQPRISIEQTNIIVTGLTAAFILYTRSAAALYFATGAVLCSLTVKLIKRAIKQPRPVVENKLGKQKMSYGMPSTHSATILYYGTFVPIACTRLPIHPTLPTDPFVTRFAPSLIVVLYAYTVAASRVWLGHHTWKQVIAGGAYGIAFAAIWFKLWEEGINDHGRTLESVVNTLVLNYAAGVARE